MNRAPHFRRGLLFLAILFCHLGWASAAPQSVTHSLHPPPAAPAPKGAEGDTDVKVYVEMSSGGSDMRLLPMSLAWQDGGRAFYTSAVNSITSEATEGDREWLGTRMGLKCVDTQAQTVRHYTRLDGLPGDLVIAVAATGPDSVYAAAVTGREWNVCRLDPQGQSWRVEARILLPAPEEVDGGAEDEDSPTFLSYPTADRALLAVGPGAICFAPGASSRATDPVFYLRDGAGAWQPVTLDPKMRGTGVLRTTFLAADAAGVWLGTSHGIFQYDPQGRRWRQFLPGQSVLRGAAHGSDIWLVAASPADAKAHQPTTRLIRFDRATGLDTDWPAPSSPAVGRPARAPSAMAVGADGRVWVTQGDAGLDEDSRFYVFDPSHARWTTLRPKGDLSPVPDAALPLPLDAYRAPAPIYESRFPEWFCPEEHGPTPPCRFGGPTEWRGTDAPATSALDRYGPIISSPGSRHPTQVTGTDGVTWSLGRNEADNNAIIQTQAGRPGREVYPWHGVAIRTNPTINGVVTLDRRLLVSANTRLWEVDPKQGQWHQADIPNLDVFKDREAGLSIRAGAGKVWLGDMEDLRVWDPRTGQSQRRLGIQGDYRILGMTGRGRLWLTDEDQDRPSWTQLYRLDPGSRTPVLMPLSLPPAIRPAKRSMVDEDGGQKHTVHFPVTPDPVALSETASGDIIWCEGWMTIKGKQVRCIIGYRPDARRWTRPQPTDWDGDPSLHTAVFDGGVFIPASDESAAVLRYDLKTGNWSHVALPVTDSIGASAADHLSILSVDEKDLWCLDNFVLRLCLYDRQTRRWAVWKCPTQFDDAGPSRAARVRDAVFVASRSGLWRFDIHSHQWSRLPVPDFDPHIDAVAFDAGAVWGKLRQGVVRFDKTAHTWTPYLLRDNTPDPMVPNEMVADGTGVWLYGNSPAYRLDPTTGRWSDVTRGALSSSKSVLAVKDVVADGRAVWLLPEGVKEGDDQHSERLIPLLGRYDTGSGRAKWFRPSVPFDAMGLGGLGMILVTQEAVWVGTLEGTFRFDKVNGTLARFTLPPQYPVPAGFAPNSVVQDGDALWFSGVGYRLRWQQ